MYLKLLNQITLLLTSFERNKIDLLVHGNDNKSEIENPKLKYLKEQKYKQHIIKAKK